ncbi:UxaA family hydrolase [Methylobacterium nigriterrae]|uniref:UxaA family hydrolase n=1 Tax=Methylobacterium nigriterrae TaxID=3127512 RepID=UPI003013680E
MKAQRAVAEPAESDQKAGIPHALAHNPKDNVAVVVVEGFKAGTKALVVVTDNNTSFTITAKHDIPIGHKLALTDLSEGDTVIKYGQDVGRMIGAAAKGEHVHTHNMKTKRW